MRRGMNPPATAVLGALLVTFPVLLGLDPSVAAMLWLWLLAPFLLPMELRATLIIVLLQLVHPALLTLPSPWPGPVGPQHRGPAAAAPAPAPGPAGVDGPGAGGPGLPGRLAPASAPGLEQGRGHLPGPARQPPGPAAIVLNNLGVARFQAGDVAGAKACFDEAAAIAAGRAPRCC